MAPELVAGVLERCGVRDKKPGALLAGFIVYFTLALALFQQDSYDDVAEQLVGGIPELDRCIPNKSSFTRARRRLGPRVLETLFRPGSQLGSLSSALGYRMPGQASTESATGCPSWVGGGA
ncbi:hypothetical protein GCM10009864_72740 [Streptomyces lunalinharesii]|uniref:Transposase IS4 N-terminal domain-containing protein n=1 Tax=Streptomyces lunalinharesii TaxID=333384 RepID=A0ABN3SX76_9ACTN